MIWVFAGVLPIVLFSLAKTEGKGGFILTSPGKLQLGANESICLQLTSFDEDVYADFRIVDNGTVIASIANTFISGKSGCVGLWLPKLPDLGDYWKKFDLEVEGVGQTSGERFTGKTKVQLVESKPGIVFIQTDKPLYKPGQLVRIRILIVDETLRPINKPVTVVLRNPLTVRLAYWEDQQSNNGLFDLEFQLSKEPVMGTWAIEATFKGVKYPTSFKVEEYVLPKYEVTVSPPKYLNPWTPEIEGKVCAKYTYGKPVVGLLRVEVCLSKGRYYYASSSSDSNRACAQFVDSISGCQDFNVNSTLLGLAFNTYSVWSAKVSFNASVEEDATGVVLHSFAETSNIKKEEVNLKFTDVSEYYKPGLPFTGKVVATRPDSTAAPGEPIRLKARNYNTGLHYEGNFTTDQTGSFFFSLPPEASEETFNLEASALRYERGSYSMPKDFHQVSESRAYFHVKPWYSRSKSYLEISTIDDTVMCDGQIPVEITYTTPAATNYRFYYQILSGGNIVAMDSVQNAFDGSEYNFEEFEAASLIRITTVAPPPKPTTEAFNETVNGTTPAPEKILEVPVPFNEDVPENAIPPPPKDIPNPESEPKRRRRETNATNAVISDRLAQFQFSIPLTTAMRSGGKLIVYYILDDGEVVADNTEFKAENCVDNKVEMRFTENPVSPGEPATLQIRATPGSLCGIGVVDKSILLLGGNNQLSLEHVLKTLKELDPMRYFYGYLDYQDSNKYCLDKVGVPEKFQDEVNETMLRLSYDWWDMPYRYQLEQTDSYESFIKMGFVVATNLDILTRPCKVFDKRVQQKFGRKYKGVARTALSSSTVQNEVIQAGEEPKARTYFPETWLWDIEKVGDDGILEVRKEIPDTITEWVGSSVCTSSKTGLGVSKSATVTVFQPFFASYTLPYSVVRGERIPIPVTVFNYLEDCLAVQLSLDTSGGGFELDGESKVTICVCGQESETHRYLITPRTIGEVNITVDARSVTDDGYCSNSLVMSSEGIGVRDIITRPLLVESEGIPEEYTRSYFVCPGENEDKRYKREIPMFLPENVILDSARGYVNIIGDLMGSALTNLDSLVRMPYGCGEQNMASFTPNIFVLQYLESTNRVTPEIQTKALNYMRIGYQRELRYRHPDGSYSSFGPGSYYGGVSTGSSWLTAFVVKSLAQARPYIYIDQDDLDKSINFFKSTQNNATGCFPQIGQSSAYLKGGNEGQANSTLTAYILSALLEANTSRQDPAVLGAVRCIEEDDFSDIYTTALAAYALTLYNEGLPFRHELLERLRNSIIEEEGQQHWERKDKPEEKNSRPWWWWRPASSAEVEMTSYALMAFITKETPGAVLIGQPIVQWLSRQRNAYGGFSSTQDTVVALQALADYGALAYSDGLDMSVTVTDEFDNDLMTVLLTKGQSLIPKKQLIEKLPTEVTVSATGVGCALVQANVRFNVEGETPKEPAFDIEVKLFQSVVEPKNCDRQRMQVCAKFTVASQVSNMAIIEVKMVTGWAPEESSLKDLTQPPNFGVRRYEIDNNIVNLYFDEISATKSCVYFEIIKELTVNNTQPGRVHVYDYYESDYSVFTTYEIEPQCNSYHWYPIWFEGDIARVAEPAIESRFENISESISEEETPMLGMGMSADSYDPCPVCLDEVPDNLIDLFCNASVAYKVQAGRGGDFKLKILADFRPSASKLVLDLFSNYALHKECNCPVLTESVKVFVFGPERIFDPEDQMLTFDGRLTVIRFVTRLDKRLRKLNCPKMLKA